MGGCGRILSTVFFTSSSITTNLCEAIAIIVVRHVDARICHSIVELRHEGLHQATIAKHFEVNQGTVSRILKRYRISGLLTPLPGRGRKPETDGTDIFIDSV